jgi:hypothetical protein
MPVSWSIRAGVVGLESDEAATFEEWKAAAEAAFADPAFRSGMSVLHDLRRFARVPSTQETQARVSFLVDRSLEHGIPRWAVVVSSPVQYGMSRMAEAFADRAPVRFRGFNDLDEALAWARDGHGD